MVLAAVAKPLVERLSTRGGYLAWMLACTEEIRRNHRAVVRSRLGGAASRGKLNLSGAFSGSDVTPSHSSINK